MNKHIQFLCLSVLIILLASECSPITMAPEEQYVAASLKEHYPKLLNEAKTWQNDAHLTLVSIQIELNTHPRDFTFWINTFFNSPSKELEGVNISMSKAGVLTTETIPYKMPIPRYNIPITEDDWVIDSPEALNIFLQDNDINHTINSIEKFCGTLDLGRLSFVEGQPVQPVVWILLIGECGKVPSSKFYLNAKTGEIFDVSDLIP